MPNYPNQAIVPPSVSPALTMHPAEPKVPTYQEMAQAIVAFAEEFYGCGLADDQGMPGDLVLLGLAERLGAFPLTPETAPGVHSVDSEPATPEVAQIPFPLTMGPWRAMRLSTSRYPDRMAESRSYQPPEPNSYGCPSSSN